MRLKRDLQTIINKLHQCVISVDSSVFEVYNLENCLKYIIWREKSYEAIVIEKV